MSAAIQYFDCDVLIGTPKAPIPNVQPGLDDLLAEMERLGIRRALVRHVACDEVGPETGNRLLSEEVRAHEQLLPVWMLTPDTCPDLGSPQALIEHMVAKSVAAAWIKPTGQEFVLEPWCCGPLLAALQERRVPLMILWDDATPRQLHEVMAAFPELPVILLRAPRRGRNRILYPLLEQHANLHCAVTPSYSVYRGIEDLCDNFGSHRFLFGTGYPHVEGGAALCMLTYAEISEADRLAIASENLERLLAEVRK